MADDTGLPHEIPFLEAADPPSIHGITSAMAAKVAERLGPVSYAEVNTSQSTLSTSAVDLATAGPSVTVTVPANGLVAVYVAAALTAAPGETSKVYLAEDGSSIGVVLSASPASSTTYYTAPGAAVGTTSRPVAGWLVFPASAASHTYKLMYSGAAGGSVTFATRRLWVRALPF